jgi:thioredoxin 1
MIKLNDENLSSLISEGLHLIDFYANWCGPCKMIEPILKQLDNEINIIQVDVDKHPALAREFKVMSIPALFFVKDGVILKQKVGFQTLDVLKEDINSLKN